MEISRACDIVVYLLFITLFLNKISSNWKTTKKVDFVNEKIPKPFKKSTVAPTFFLTSLWMISYRLKPNG